VTATGHRSAVCGKTARTVRRGGAAGNGGLYPTHYLLYCPIHYNCPPHKNAGHPPGTTFRQVPGAASEGPHTTADGGGRRLRGRWQRILRAEVSAVAQGQKCRPHLLRPLYGFNDEEDGPGHSPKNDPTSAVTPGNSGQESSWPVRRVTGSGYFPSCNANTRTVSSSGSTIQ